MMKRIIVWEIVALIMFIGNCLALEKTSTGYYYPTNKLSQSDESSWLDCDDDYFDEKCHIGHDFMATIGTPVYPISDGEIVYTSTSAESWGTGNVGIFVKHRNIDGTEFLALYGHIKNVNVVNNKVYANRQFAEIGAYPYGNHLHFGIFPGLNYPSYGWGMIPSPASHPYNGFVNPIEWIKNKIPNPNIGDYSDGYHDDGSSQAFQDKVVKLKLEGVDVGYPTDRGKGAYVHQDCVEENGEEYCVTRQDFFNHDTQKAYAMILNDLGDEVEVGLLQGAILSQYDLEKGPYAYGVPYTGEIVAHLAESHLSKTTDIVVPCGLKGACESEGPTRFVLQEFYPITPTGERNGNERRTMVHNMQNGATGHLAVGAFKVVNDTTIGLTKASDGNRVRFADPNDPFELYQWPIYDQYVPQNVVPTNVYYRDIMNWYALSGRYLVRIETSNLDEIATVAHEILEGNDQYMSVDPATDPSNLAVTSVTETSISLRCTIPETSNMYDRMRVLNGV